MEQENNNQENLDLSVIFNMVNKHYHEITITQVNGHCPYGHKKGEKFKEVMRLPSGGDTGYPGIFSIGGYVWMSYYSSHEGKTSVYYARIPYKDIN